MGLSTGDIMLLGSTTLLVSLVLSILYSTRPSFLKEESFQTNDNSIPSPTDAYIKTCERECMKHPITGVNQCSIRNCKGVPRNIPWNTCVIDFIDGNCISDASLKTSTFAKDELVLTLSTYENVYFSIFNRTFLENEALPIQQDVLHIYRMGINLIGYKIFLTKNTTNALRTPYTLTRVSCPPGYRLYFEMMDTKSTLKIIDIPSGTDIPLSEPIEVNPKKYKSIYMKLIPS